MKIKIFEDSDVKKLEKDVNAFIKDKSVQDIKINKLHYVTSHYSNGVPSSATILTTITVLYCGED